jgi:hypothetical protein
MQCTESKSEREKNPKPKTAHSAVELTLSLFMIFYLYKFLFLFYFILMEKHQQQQQLFPPLRAPPSENNGASVLRKSEVQVCAMRLDARRPHTPPTRRARRVLLPHPVHSKTTIK